MNADENQIVVYQPNETVRLDVRLENETVWLTQLEISELFGVQKAIISKHINNIFVSGELVKDATVSKMETVQNEGGRWPLYLRLRQDGRRNHPRTSRLNLQGNNAERKITDCKRKKYVSKPSKRQNTTRRTVATRTTHWNVRRAIV